MCADKMKSAKSIERQQNSDEFGEATQIVRTAEIGIISFFIFLQYKMMN